MRLTKNAHDLLKRVLGGARSLILFPILLAYSCVPITDIDIGSTDELSESLLRNDVDALPRAIPPDIEGALDSYPLENLRWKSAILFRQRMDMTSQPFDGPAEMAKALAAVSADPNGFAWIDEAKSLLVEAQELDDPLSEYYLRIALGEHALRAADDAEAIAQFLAASEASRMAGIVGNDGVLALAEAFQETDKGNHQAAFARHVEAVSHYSKTGQRNQARRMCVFLDRTGRKVVGDLGTDYVRELASESELPQEAWRAVCLYSVAAIAEIMGGNGIAARADLDNAYEISLDLGDGFFLENILNFQAAQAYFAADTVTSIQKFEEGIELAEAMNSVLVAAHLYSNLAITVRQTGDTDRAIELQQKSIDLVLDNAPERHDLLCSRYLSMGGHYAAANQHQTATEWYEKSKVAQERAGDVSDPGALNREWAKSLYELGQVEVAIQTAQSAVEASLETRPTTGIVLISWIGARLGEIGELEQARDYLTRVDELVEIHGEPSNVEGNEDEAYEFLFNRNITELYLSLGMTEQAAARTQRVLELSDARLDKQKLASVANFDVRMQLRDNEIELEAADREREILALQVDQSRLRAIIAVIAAIATLAIAIGLYRGYRSQIKLGRLKDTFLSEIHHRTKNNLQILVSLLNLQERWASSDEGQSVSTKNVANRARVMSLVHDHLYGARANADSALELNAFLDELLDLMGESYGTENVKLLRDLQAVTVDPDVATPLGLIACELIMNSYKHAFDSNDGKIVVELKADAGAATLIVEDDGHGAKWLDAENRKDSLGLELVFGLAKQIGAALNRENGPNGTTWRLASIPTI